MVSVHEAMCPVIRVSKPVIFRLSILIGVLLPRANKSVFIVFRVETNARSHQIN